MTLGSAVSGQVIDLGEGQDHVILANAPSNVITLVNVERVTGGGGNDTVTLLSGVANGRVELGAGTDVLNLSSSGPNRLLVSGVETLNGSSNDDDITLLTAVSGIRVSLNGGNDRLQLAGGTNSSIWAAGPTRCSSPAPTTRSRCAASRRCAAAASPTS